jgi:translation initiation factor 2 alpha subunit (eIF-2alpha)
MKDKTNNAIEGGKADNKTIVNIADKFDLPITKIQQQIKKGEKVELEHTDDLEKAKEISMDHLSEFPDYYDRLGKMEKDASKAWENTNVTENTKNLIKRLIRKNLDQ